MCLVASPAMTGGKRKVYCVGNCVITGNRKCKCVELAGNRGRGESFSSDLKRGATSYNESHLYRNEILVS